MKIRLVAVLLLILTDASGASASQFCYRDTQGELICANNIEDLPVEFQKKAFYLDLPRASENRNTQAQPKVPPPRNPPPRNPPPRNNVTERAEQNSPGPINGLPPARTLAPSDGEQSSEKDYSSTSTAPINRQNNIQQPQTSSQITSKKSAQVKIVVAEWCGYCRALEKFLRAEGVSYEALDIDHDPRAAALYQQHGSLPISQIGETLVVGFDPKRYKSLLEANLPY